MAPLNGRQRPKKRFGQHFLVNGHIADRIVESACVGPDDVVLEIGPGKGVLTGRLLEKAHDVYAVEIDRDLAASLRERFNGRDGFHLIEKDILATDLDKLFADRPSRIRVVSNIPYNISAPIVDLLIRHRKIVSSAVLMVQKEVAQRLLAKPGTKDYGLLTLNLAICATGRKIVDVKPGSFSPPPEIMSTVVSLEFVAGLRYPLRNEKLFRVLTGVAFRKRRKMVRNSLVPFLVSHGMNSVSATDLLRSSGIDPEARPDCIDPGRYVELSNVCIDECPSVTEGRL